MKQPYDECMRQLGWCSVDESHAVARRTQLRYMHMHPPINVDGLSLNVGSVIAEEIGRERCN